MAAGRRGYGDDPDEPYRESTHSAFTDTHAALLRRIAALPGRSEVTIGLYHPRALHGDGGITRSVRSLSTALEDQGHATRVIYHGPPSTAPARSWVGLRAVELGPLNVPIGLDEAIADLDVLVLHSAWVSFNAIAGARARTRGLPYVLAHRGAYEPRIRNRRRLAKQAWWNLFEKRLVDGASAIHVFFESQAGQIRELGYEGPLLVAPNGVRVPEDLTWDGGSSGALVYVGRFDMEHKGLDNLLGGLELMSPEERPDVVLCGPDWRGGKAKTREAISRRGLDPWVSIRPPIHGRAKYELMASARAFVYPSSFEAFGNSAAEAASLGVPVLTGNYPLGRYLAENRAGIAVAPSPTDMAMGLRAIQGPDAARLGASARVVMRRFTWDAVAREWASQLLNLTPART